MGLGSFDPARARADDLCGSNTEHGKRKVQPFRRSNDSFQESLHRSPLQISRRASEEAMPSLVPVVGKLGSVELVNTQCNVLPWSPVKIKWKILDENPKDAFLALYPAGEHDLEHYESSILCRGHVAATSVMISPHIPGFYTLRLVRAPSETLGLTTFRVVAPIEGASGNRPGQWLADPEEFSDEVENYVNNDLRELIRGRIRFSDDDPLNATGPISEQSSSEVVESPAPALAKITRRRAAAPPPTQESQR